MFFGCLKDSEENRKFICELEDAQVKIRNSLKSRTFLEDILYKLTGNQYCVSNCVNFSFSFVGNKLNHIVARGIWESLQCCDKEYLSYFISGMENPEAESNDDGCAYFPRSRRELIQAKNNLVNTNHLFSEFEKKEDLKPIIPEKLYYKILKQGQGETICDGPLVSLDFDIFLPSGCSISQKSNVTINLKNTIPGFALGVRGMKIGETREIFIHPSLGYGFDTSLAKCETLRAVVTLKDIYVNQRYSQSEQTLDLDFIFNESMNNEQLGKYKAALFEKGKQIAHHLKKGSQVDLTVIRSYLKDFQNNAESWKPTTEEEQCLINQMHWNIYFS